MHTMCVYKCLGREFRHSYLTVKPVLKTAWIDQQLHVKDHVWPPKMWSLQMDQINRAWATIWKNTVIVIKKPEGKYLQLTSVSFHSWNAMLHIFSLIHVNLMVSAHGPTTWQKLRQIAPLSAFTEMHLGRRQYADIDPTDRVKTSTYVTTTHDDKTALKIPPRNKHAHTEPHTPRHRNTSLIQKKVWLA